jgi:hypothetical protein
VQINSPPSIGFSSIAYKTNLTIGLQSKADCPNDVISTMSQGHDDAWNVQHYRDTQVEALSSMLVPDGESPSDCDT